YTVGMSGIELAHEVLYITFGTEIEVKQYYTLDKSPEYWGMWSLAYYQFESELSFGRLLEYVTFDIVLQLYPTLHEADISKFVDVLDARIELYRNNTETTIARLRRMQGYSQRVLAEQSGVSLRMIQLYEQRQNDINKAQAETLLKLAKALHCSMEELMV
ncbi:MAG: helix-turn-helix transcriptional regulator, partial [Eubacteriales bacterium]